MSLSHGPSFATSGLVFACDMTNTQKSWKGAPITNVQWNSGSEITPWTVGGQNNDVSSTIGLTAPIPQAKTWEFIKTGTSSQWNGWENSYGGIWTGSSGDYWSTSYWYKTQDPAGATGFGIGNFFTSDWSRSYNTTVIDSVSSIIADGNWHYNYTVVRFNENYSNAIIVDGPSWGYSTSSGLLYVNGLCWNKNSYAAPWAAGTRSNTQAIVDLTGNNTVTVNNLTYANDGTFSFNGSSDYVTAGTLPGSFSSFTVSVWFNSTSVSNYRNPIDCNFSYNGTVGNIGPRLEQNSSGALGWVVSGNTSNNSTFDSFVVKSSGLQANTWYNAVITWTNGSANTYLNGVPVTINASTPNGFVNVFNNVIIGKGYHLDAASIRSFTGQISTVQIYNASLTATQILQNFNARKGLYGV